MGWKAWLLVAAIVGLFLSTVRIHFMPGRFGDQVTFEFVKPWSR